MFISVLFIFFLFFLFEFSHLVSNHFIGSRRLDFDLLAAACDIKANEYIHSINSLLTSTSIIILLFPPPTFLFDFRFDLFYRFFNQFIFQAPNVYSVARARLKPSLPIPF